MTLAVEVPSLYLRYLWVLIAVGTMGIVLLIVLILLLRLWRHAVDHQRRRAKEREERRATGNDDLWHAGGQRYIDALGPAHGRGFEHPSGEEDGDHPEDEEPDDEDRGPRERPDDPFT
jgi:hypothetical protein